MGYEITADAMFRPGQCAPRGTYISVQTGLVHRLTKPTRLPEGGPFRMVAAEPVMGHTVAQGAAQRWPGEETRPAAMETSSGWLALLTAFGSTRTGKLW